MESSGLNTDFQTQLKSIEFKTYFRNQAQKFGYEDLFSNRRILIFSITRMYFWQSVEQVKQFDAQYDKFLSLGLDDVCAVNSSEPLFGPCCDKQTKKIKGLTNLDGGFVSALADYYNNNKPIKDLMVHWQYITIIDNGVPEHLWQNPFKANLPLYIFKDPGFLYRKLHTDLVINYLIEK
jgi:peroxiredoxin